MVRPSNKTLILDAAIAVIESEGITAVTFDSVADAAGLTRGGIIYHYRSRDELIQALHRHLASEWEEQLVRACGKSAEEASELERLIAYIQVAANSATRAEIQMLVDSKNTGNHGVWSEVITRWTASPQSVAAADRQSTVRTSILAADGLWMNDVINQEPLSEDQRQLVIDQIVDRLVDAFSPS